MANKDIYFKQDSFLNSKYESIEKFINSCVKVDLFYLSHLGGVRIWVNYEELSINKRSLFCKKVQRLLNAHYYEYVIFINKYLNNIRKKCNKKQ